MKHISKSRSLILILCMMCLFFLSCRSLDPSLYTIHRDSVAYTTHQSVDTVVVRDSVYRHDSVIYRERTIHDTVYITKEIYRDTHNSSLIARNSTLSDTVRVVEYRDRIVKSPPERYVPKFYKWCTIALWAIGLLAIGYWLLKWRIKRYL